jgi:hypothetical protein
MGVEWVWCGCGVGVVWCGCGVGVVWCGCGVGAVWVWCGCGVGVVWVWCGCGVGVIVSTDCCDAAHSTRKRSSCASTERCDTFFLRGRKFREFVSVRVSDRFKPCYSADVCVYVYTHTYAYACAYTYTYASTYTYAYAYAYHYTAPRATQRSCSSRAIHEITQCNHYYARDARQQQVPACRQPPTHMSSTTSSRLLRPRVGVEKKNAGCAMTCGQTCVRTLCGGVMPLAATRHGHTSFRQSQQRAHAPCVAC